jgi:thiol-disulfide isomerase/thioredoxin
MNLTKDIFSWVKRNCENDETCVMIVFIVIGFLLCWLFKDQISGYMNFAEVSGDNHFNIGGEIASGIKSLENSIGLPTDPRGPSSGSIGIELKKRKPDPTPSTEKQLGVMASKPSVTDTMRPQMPGIKVQDSMMFRPFDEIWNPGFMPLDMVFKNVVSGPKVGPINVPSGPTKTDPAGDLSLVLVYAPWCGHSKRMLPDYEKVKSEFNGKIINGKKINVIMYNSDVDKDKVKEYEVNGFPSLFVEKDGVRESFPHRNYEKISDYLNNI